MMEFVRIFVQIISLVYHSRKIKLGILFQISNSSHLIYDSNVFSFEELSSFDWHSEFNKKTLNLNFFS